MSGLAQCIKVGMSQRKCVETCGHHDRIYWGLHVLTETSRRPSAAFESDKSEDDTESLFNADCCCNEVIVAVL